MVPAAFMTYNIVKDSIFKTNVNKFVNERLDNAGTRVISYDINKDSMTLRIVAVGMELPDSSIKAAERAMPDYKLGRYRLQVIQGSESDSVMMLNNRLATCARLQTIMPQCTTKKQTRRHFYRNHSTNIQNTET